MVGPRYGFRRCKRNGKIALVVIGGCEISLDEIMGVPKDNDPCDCGPLYCARRDDEFGGEDD